MINREKVKAAFAQYTSAYNSEDPKIKLKIDHTYRVARWAEEIAESIDGSVDIGLAWLSGMLHDIGRFEQVARFGTFADAESVDHGQLGADLLFGGELARGGAVHNGDPEHGMLSDFTDLSEEDRHILELAIRSHNIYCLDDHLTEKERMYCNIIRDADKIDIFRVNCETPLEDIYNVTTEELKNAAVTEEVKDCFLKKQTVLRSLKKSPIDHLVGHVCLTFGLVYPKSLELAKEQGYVDKLLSFRSENADTQNWLDFMRENIWKINAVK